MICKAKAMIGIRSLTRISTATSSPAIDVTWFNILVLIRNTDILSDSFMKPSRDIPNDKNIHDKKPML